MGTLRTAPTHPSQVERTCGACGVAFWLRPSVVKPVNYCSRTCAGAAIRGRRIPEAQRQHHSEVMRGRPNPSTAARNRRQLGEQHPAWKGDRPDRFRGRHRAIRRYPAQPCEVCGEAPIPGTRNIHRHHKDCNSMNNAPTNIAFLCRAHHAEAHRAIRRARSA